MKSVVRIYDEKLSILVEKIPRSYNGPMNFISFLGNPVVVLFGLAIMIMFGLRKNLDNLALAGTIGVIALLGNTLLKYLLHRARPLTIYAGRMKIQSYSFPSGHAFGATMFYGQLAYIVQTRLSSLSGNVLALALATMFLLIGMSRVYLGAHFPSDVIAGWLLGALTVAITIRLTNL